MTYDIRGKVLFINWPLAWSPWLYDFKARIEAGEIGHAFHFRMRLGRSRRAGGAPRHHGGHQGGERKPAGGDQKRGRHRATLALVSRFVPLRRALAGGAGRPPRRAAVSRRSRSSGSSRWRRGP